MIVTPFFTATAVLVSPLSFISTIWHHFLGNILHTVFTIPVKKSPTTEQAMAVDESGYGVIEHGVIDFVFIPYSI